MRLKLITYSAFSLISLCGTFFIFNNSVKADFGDAEAPNSSIDKKNSYDAWCGKRGNDCTVDFNNNSILINKKNSVQYSQIINFSHQQELSNCAAGQIFFCNKGGDTFYIDYTKNNGEKGQGVILFGNKKVAGQFKARMRLVTNQTIFTDPNCDRYGDVFYKGVCMSKSEADQRYLDFKAKSREELIDTFDKINENQFRQRELDIKQREADAKIFDAYNNQNKPSTNIYIYE